MLLLPTAVNELPRRLLVIIERRYENSSHFDRHGEVRVYIAAALLGDGNVAIIVMDMCVSIQGGEIHASS